MKKKALVLAGGGSRGSYQIGVWRALRELGWSFDIVTGTSVGALNGALVVQNDFDVAVEMWENISTTDVLSMEMDDKIDSLRDFNAKLGLFLGEMAKNGGADPRPLEDILRRCVDEERIRSSPVDFKIVTVEYPSLTPRIMSKENLPEGELVDYLMASAACFPAMKMRQIGATKYIDGGYYDNMPVNLAVESGAEEIVAVDLEAIGRQKRVASPNVKVRYIRSKWDLGVFILFDKDVAKRNMKLGYLDAMKELGKLEGTAYTFEKGETQANARALSKQFDLITMKTGLVVQRYSRLAVEPNANIRLARVVRGGEQMRMTSDGAIAAAGETAARVFGLSPLETYTFEQINDLLRAKLYEIHTAELAKLIEVFSDMKKPRDLLHALGMLDKRHVAAFCQAELRRAYEQGAATPRLAVLAKLVGDEFTAGLYLLALELLGGGANLAAGADDEAECAL